MDFEKTLGLVVQWSWLGLVLLGGSLLVAVVYFRHQSKRLSEALSQLYDLNQKVEQDALAFFEHGWHTLSTVGCLQLRGTIDWFGERKHVQHGSVFPQGRNLHEYKRSFNVSRDDMRFEFVLYLNREAAEQGSLSSLVIKTFVNTLEQNLVLKQAEILTSQKRLERYQLFVQHEIKNIAQFIQLLSEQLILVTTDQDRLRLVKRIQSTVPIMANRASRTLEHMKQPLSEFYEGRVIGVNSLLTEVSAMYELNVVITGEAEVNLPNQLLQEVFKNVLGNFRDHGLPNKPIKIDIMPPAGEQVLIEIISTGDASLTEIESERLFEPFWTTSESGMGLGLFLARELLKQFKGEIRFESSSEHFKFIVKIPCLERG
ncbi:MAG: HAMP domain-containing histidine kinase [Gammaproteobacteria bacterium]|nr:HAMP domain-containing histidine kinase [Gammaproteobacteria bacterium]